MTFNEFARFLEKLESTPKRLEITSILTELIKNLETDEVEKGVYLSLGILKAQYESPKFNIADKMMLRVLDNAYSPNKKELNELYAKKGDLGDVAYEISKGYAKLGHKVY